MGRKNDLEKKNKNETSNPNDSESLPELDDRKIGCSEKTISEETIKRQADMILKAVRSLIKVRKIEVLSILESNGTMPFIKIAKKTGITKGSLWTILNDFVSEGLIESKMQLVKSKAIRMFTISSKYKDVKDQIIKQFANDMVNNE